MLLALIQTGISNLQSHLSTFMLSQLESRVYKEFIIAYLAYIPVKVPGIVSAFAA